MNQNKDWNLVFGKVFTQTVSLGLALIGYRGLMRFFLGYESFWWYDVFALVFGVFLFLLYELT
jgi:hypothetical protein